MSKTESTKPLFHGDRVLFAKALNERGIIASPALLDTPEDVAYLFPNFPVEQGQSLAVSEYVGDRDASLFIKRAGSFPHLPEIDRQNWHNKFNSIILSLTAGGSLFLLANQTKEFMDAVFPNNWKARHNDATVECEKSIHAKFDKEVHNQSAANQDITHKGYSVHADFSAATATQAVQECVPAYTEGQQIKDVVVGGVWLALFIGISYHFAKSAAGHIGDFLESRKELKTFKEDRKIVEGDRKLMKRIQMARKIAGHSPEVA